jgi:DtxR family Mn-dependent transcriptional regulator
VGNEALSESIQDYLKGIYQLRPKHGSVTVSALARRLGVSQASASAMVKKLAALELVAERAPYRGVELTDAGERIALEVIRHHRLLELYLAETLGLSIDAVHAEADRLEHVLSEELEARIDRALGYPTHDPHGDPIPDADLHVAAGTELRALAELVAGDAAVVRRVPDADASVLRQLSELGLVPGNAVTLLREEPLTVAVEGAEHVVPRELAAQVRVD